MKPTGKRILIALSAALLLAALAVPSFAAILPRNNPAGIMNGQVKKLAKGADTEEAKAKIETIRGCVATARELRSQDALLRRQNAALRKELTAKLKQIKQSGMLLPADAISQLNALSAALKAGHKAIAGTTGDVLKQVKLNRVNVKNRDYDAVIAAYGQIVATMRLRNEKLQDINDTMSRMVALVNGAALIPRPTATPTPAPTGGVPS